jgi:hypothetical protein
MDHQRHRPGEVQRVEPTALGRGHPLRAVAELVCQSETSAGRGAAESACRSVKQGGHLDGQRRGASAVDPLDQRAGRRAGAARQQGRLCRERLAAERPWQRSRQLRQDPNWARRLAQERSSMAPGQGLERSLRAPEPAERAGPDEGVPPVANAQPEALFRSAPQARRAQQQALTGRAERVAPMERAPTLHQRQARPLSSLEPRQQARVLAFPVPRPEPKRSTLPMAPARPLRRRSWATPTRLSLRWSSSPPPSLLEPSQSSALRVADRESNLRARPCDARGPLEHR